MFYSFEYDRQINQKTVFVGSFWNAEQSLSLDAEWCSWHLWNYLHVATCVVSASVRSLCRSYFMTWCWLHSALISVTHIPVLLLTTVFLLFRLGLVQCFDVRSKRVVDWAESMRWERQRLRQSHIPQQDQCCCLNTSAHIAGAFGFWRKQEMTVWWVSSCYNQNTQNNSYGD